VLLVQNFSIVTGTTSAIVNLLPWLLVIATIAGVAYALWMRTNDPQRYAGLAVTPTRSDDSPLWPEPALVNGNQRYTSRASDTSIEDDREAVLGASGDDDRVREGAQSGRRSHA
jgi:hypothetical protein